MNTREEGHYTIKRVDKLPKRGNANWLYILKTDIVDKFYRALGNGSYEELNIGSSSTQDITDFTFNPLDNTLTISIEDGNTMVADLTFLKDEFAPNIIVDTYDDLLLVTGQTLFEFTEVRNAQGTSWLPGSLGGMYYAAGLYYWNGTDWIHDNDAILQGLSELTVAIETQSFDSRIIVKQSNVATTLGGTIDPTKEYFIDGIIDMSGITVTVPAGGVNIKGFDFNISQLICSDNNYTMFDSPVGGSGDIIWLDIGFTVSGTNSQLLDVVGATGFEAFEIGNINFNDCTSLGTIDTYRQGLETGTGRFGGTPQLTLSGTWVGGYFIDTSIVRGLTDGVYSLYSTGPGLSMGSRFRSNQNIDLPASASFVDFIPGNFVDPSSLLLEDIRITRSGNFDATDTNLVPNTSAGDLTSDWRGNVGLPNTFVGGKLIITGEVTTNITNNDFVDLLATWVTSNLQHFDSPAAGQLRHLGNSPREYQISGQFVLEAGSNQEVDLKIVIWRDATTSFEDAKVQRRVINNLQGGRNVAYFIILDYIILDQNDYVKLQVANVNDTTNIVAELDSFFVVSSRS